MEVVFSFNEILTISIPKFNVQISKIIWHKSLNKSYNNFICEHLKVEITQMSNLTFKISELYGRI